MLKELDSVLAAVPGPVGRGDYDAAVVQANCLLKPTAATRRLSSQRLAELYALDPYVAIFRVMRRLWNIDPRARPQLAMLAALARDPLFMGSSLAVVTQPAGAEFQRAPVKNALRTLVGERMNDATLDKVVRNVSSSWAQTGHLDGRTFKSRRHVHPQPASVAFALWLGNAAGLQGDQLLTSGWVATLDCAASTARSLALEAKRLGLIDLQFAGEAVDFGLDRLDPGLGRT